MSELDLQMADWRSTNMRQRYPQKLRKIEPYIEIVKGLLKPEDSLLDVGCGRGFVYRYLEHKNYLGIDIREKEVMRARERFPDAKFELADLFDMEGKWDVVLCSRVLMHIAPLQGALDKLLSLASRRLFLVVPIGDKETLVKHQHEEGDFYFRTIEPGFFAGAKICHETGKYSLVTYDMEARES